MIIFALETSCDETSAAVLRAVRGKHGQSRLTLLANVVSSQIAIHKKFGGVVPEVAARAHAENILPIIDEALALAKIKPTQIDLLAVVTGPGLITSLMVGAAAARTLSYAWQKPLLAVNHMYGHLAANFLNAKIKFPAVCLIVSGGHTEILFLKNYWQFKKIGQTVDDAAGEAFDKVAKLLRLGYPGGPIVSLTALAGQPDKFKLPRPMLRENNFNFSFSGLKTAVLYAAQKLDLSDSQNVADLCLGFEQAAVEVLTQKTWRAAREFKAKTILTAGGVAANQYLRESLAGAAKDNGFDFSAPEFKLCTDNAAMIAIAAYYLQQKKSVPINSWQKIKVDPNWELD